MISVFMTDAFTYQVDAGDTDRSQYKVTMTQECYLDLSQGQFTHEWVLVNVFRALMSQGWLSELEAELDLTRLLEQHDGLSDMIKAELSSGSR